MADFVNLLGKSKPAKLTSFYRRAPNAVGGLLCGARMTCPTYLHEWCLSVVPGWPDQHICMSGVYSPISSSCAASTDIPDSLLIGLRAFDLVSSRVWWEATTNNYPWLSHATFPYCSSPLAGLQDYIPYPHLAAECMFELVVLLLPGHMLGSIGVYHLWARPECLVRLASIVFVMGGRWPYSWCLVRCCRQDLFNIARSIIV